MVNASYPIFQYLRSGILWAFAWCFVVSGLNAQKYSFPGKQSEAKSPDDRYAIKNHDDEKEDLAHFLTLTDMKNHSTKRVYSYGRHVEVLWSPTSLAFIVNDYEGSDAAHPILFRLPWRKGEEVDLRRDLTSFLRSRHQEARILKNHHVYFTIEQWLSGDEFLCKLTGYGDASPEGFTHHYVYTIGKGFRVLSDHYATVKSSTHQKD